MVAVWPQKLRWAVAALAGLATFGFFALRPAGSTLNGGLRASVLRHGLATPDAKQGG